MSEKKFSLSGLFGYLAGKGVKVKLNESAASEDQQFELVEDGTDPSPADQPVTNQFSDEEAVGIKKMIALFAEVEPEAFANALKGMPAVTHFIQNAEETAKTQKAGVIASIKANSANVYTDEELEGMAFPVLNKLDAQMNVNYMALGGAQDIYVNESEAPLQPKAALFAMAEQEAE